MDRKSIQQEFDAIVTLLLELENKGQKDLMQDLDFVRNDDTVVFLEETLKSCADTNKKTCQEEELVGRLLQVSQNAGAPVESSIIEDSNASKDIVRNFLEKRRLLEEIFRELLEKCFQGEEMFSTQTLRRNIDDLSRDIDDFEITEVASRQEIFRDRDAMLREYSDQYGHLSLFSRNELRDLEERSLELKKSLLAKEEENSDSDKELKKFLE